MDRKLAETIVGGALEVIKTALQAYMPEEFHCSIYVTDHSTAAFMIQERDNEDDPVEYTFYIYKADEEEDRK